MAVKDYQDKLFDAISVVAESKVKSYHYDQTIEAVVKDDTNAENGRYQVEYTNGVFEAYGTGERYYKNDTVYVTIPQGDFTLQKFIIGRKINIEQDPGTTFNFRMPFDDFITLRDLTNITVPARISTGYIANYPEHGKEIEATDDYRRQVSESQERMTEITANWKNQMDIFTNNVNELKKKFNDINYEIITKEETVSSTDVTGHTVIEVIQKEERNPKVIETGESLSSYNYNGISYRQAIVNIINRDVTINGNWKEQNNAYVTTWNEINAILNDFLSNVLQIELSKFAWDDNDLHIFLSTIESCYNLGHASQNASYQLVYKTASAQEVKNLKDLAENANNINLLWSWTNDDDGRVLIETKLGVSIDVQTLLGDYQPIDGLYGIRLVLTGTTKPTEEEMSRSVTETIYFTNEDMYGNTYGYYSPYTQQKILDISNFLTLTHIDCYFWQELDENKHIFRDYNGVKIPYEIEPGILMPSNIIIGNLKVLLGITAEEATSDRALLYCYEDEEYGIAPNEIDDPAALARSDQKTLRLAWIHITEDGPVLVDHEKKKYDSDVNSLEYWNAKIYWYNYQYGIPLDESNEAQKYGGTSWKPKPFDQEGITDNFTYSDDNANYILEVMPSREKIREKYRALILEGNTPIRSNILQFTNRDVTVAEATFESLYDVVFRFLKGTVSDQGTQMKIVQDNSIGNFFVYDENNDVISDEHGVPYSDIPYYVQIWIRNNETGDYSPATLDSENGIQEVNWEPFGNLSMITEFTEPSDSELENTELAPLTGDMTDEQKRILKLTTRRFKIASKWVMSYTNNFIRATVLRKNNKLYSVQKELLFGESGTMGSPYTIVLQQTKPDNGEMIQDQPFEIVARIFERGIERPNVRYIFMWQILSPTVIVKNEQSNVPGYIDMYNHEQSGSHIDGQEIGEWWHSELTYGDRDGYVNNVISGIIKNDMPLIVKCICKECADYDISTTVGYGLVNNNSIIFNNNLQVQCPDRVEYKSDGTAPIADMGEFFVKKKKVSAQNQTALNCGYLFQDKYDDEDEEYDELYPDMIYPEWKIFSYTINYEYNEEQDEATGQIVQKHISEGYLNGGENTLYNSLSLISREESPSVITTDKLQNINLEGHKVYKLSTTNDYSINGNRVIHGNSEAPASWYWDDSYEKDYYVVLQWQKELTVTNKINGNDVTESTNYWFKQAVPLTLNVYSSSLINTWDGQLLIDDVNNAILAKMIAAGTKNKNNQFNGIMMGDWTSKGDSSFGLDSNINIITGLYGFKNGRQVFSFRTDGTGFIGKSGKGQIQFDGNYSLISNADKTCYINLDPVYYKYDGQDIRIKNYNSYSQYFLWAESEATTKTDGSEEKDYIWANELLQAVKETNRDLFVVDPNNGILTTGGIYAKYGRLGKYLLLNDSGLIYKQYLDDKNEYIINEDLPNSENNDIIYIGQERTRDGNLIPLDQIDRTYDHYYWSSKSYESPGRAGREQAELSDKVGRYVIWAGNKIGTHAYPKFGVEHDGTVHLTEAYVEGVIHASTLVVGDEDISEYQRNRKQKTFYTKINQESDVIGTNPALLKEEPNDNTPKWLWGGYHGGANTGTCKKSYGDWLRPGDVWYIESSIAPKVIVFKGTGNGTIEAPNYTNLYGLQVTELKFNDYSIRFSDSALSYETRESDIEGIYEIINNDPEEEHIIYNGYNTGGLEYIQYNFDGTKYSENTILNDNDNIQPTSYDTKSHEISTTNISFNTIDITALEYKLSKISEKLSSWTNEYLNTAKNNYNEDPTNKDKLNAYNRAMNGALDIQSYYDTYQSIYDALYSRLEIWAINLNIDAEDSALAKTSYSMSSLILEKLGGVEIQIEDKDKEGDSPIILSDVPSVPKLNDLDINSLEGDTAILAEESLSEPQLSYTEFVWEGILDEDEDNISSTNQNPEDNHEWFGIWTESNALPPGAEIKTKITVNQLTNNPGAENQPAPGYIHPKYRYKSTKSGTKSRWYDAPPGWRRVGAVDNESIWDALKHSTFTFNSALQSTTYQLTNNLNQWIQNLMEQTQLSKKKALKELNKQRKELVNMLTNLQKDVNKTVFKSVAAIRNGMDPISFFGDGNCHVFITNHLYDSNVSGIGMVPAGITVAQLPGEDDDDKLGSTFYLNSKRMGFYRAFKEKINNETIQCNIPLLAYYNGSMALAGSMFFGLDYNNYIKQQGLNIKLKFDKDGNLPISTVASNNPDAFNNNTQYADISLYKNYIDGPNCRIVLGNGTIVLDGLDNGLTIEGQKNKLPFPNALKTGKQEGGTPFVYIGANPNASDGDNYKCGVVRIGAKGAGMGKLSLADFELASTAYNDNVTILKVNELSNESKSYSYNFQPVGIVPELKLSKNKNNQTITIKYIDTCSIDNNNVSISIADADPITIDTYADNNSEDWTTPEVKEEEYKYTLTNLDVSDDSIELDGDILAITQKTDNGHYTGLGIVGNNNNGIKDGKVILGPIRYVKDVTNQSIDIRGYKKLQKSGNDGCWLVGWNFYGIDILSNNIYNAGNIITDGNIFKYHKSPKNSSEADQYVKILDELEVFDLINNSETRLAGSLSSNLVSINTSLSRIYDSLNNHTDAFITIANILSKLAQNTQSLANGVNKALGASDQNKNGIGNALNAANEALGKANQALTKSICQIKVVADYESDYNGDKAEPGLTYVTLRVWTNPLQNEGEGILDESLVTGLCKVASQNHQHQMALSISQGQLRLYSKEPTRAGTDSNGHQLNYTDDNMLIDIGQDFKDYFSFSEQNKQNISRISGMNDAISHPRGEHRGEGDIDIYTHLKFWGSLIEGHTTKKDPFLDFDMYFGISQVVENITYTAAEIDKKVEQAFKKGWEDGWTKTYLETNFDTSTTYAFTITAKYDTYTCQYGTVISSASGTTKDNKYLLLDIRDSEYWKKTAFGSFDYDGNNKITAIAKDLSTSLDYTYAYLNVKTYQTGSKQYEYSINTAQSGGGTQIASGEIGAVAAYNDGYDDGYIEGWRNAVNSLKAKLTHTGGNDASGNVIATASIESQSYKRKTNSQDYTLSGNSDTDSAYLSFDKGSDSHSAQLNYNQYINAGSGNDYHLTGNWYADASAELTGDHSYGSLTWY